MNSKFVMPLEMAIAEVQAFVEYHTDNETTPEAVNEDYPSVVSSVRQGLLLLQPKDGPVFTLREPILTESGAAALDKVTFRTRINAETYQNLAKGLDLKKDSLKFANAITAYLANLDATAMLNKFPNKHDYKTIQQLTSLFT